MQRSDPVLAGYGSTAHTGSDPELLAPVQELLARMLPAETQEKLPPEWRRALERILTSSIRAGAAGLTIRGGLHLLAFVASLAKSRRKGRTVGLADALLDTAVYTAFLASMASVYTAVDESLAICLGKNRTAKWRALVAGIVAGQTLCITGPKKRHYTLATYVLLRGLTLLVRTGNKTSAPPLLRALLAPTRMQHGDTLLMCIATSQILYSFIMEPDSLPHTYVRFITRQGGKDPAVWAGIREQAQRNAVGLPPGPLKALAGTVLERLQGAPLATLRAAGQRLMAAGAGGSHHHSHGAAALAGLDLPLAAAAAASAPASAAVSGALLGGGGMHHARVPCAFFHPGQSCSEHAVGMLPEGFMRALYVYVPFYLVSTLLVHRHTLLQPAKLEKLAPKIALGIARSAAFLSVYVATAFAGACAAFTLTDNNTGAIISGSVWAGGLATLIEKKSRRMELALYCMARAMEAAARCWLKWGWLPGLRTNTPNSSSARHAGSGASRAVPGAALLLLKPSKGKGGGAAAAVGLGPRFDLLLFSLGCGAIMHCYSDSCGAQRDVFRSKYLNVLDFIFGNQGVEAGSIQHVPTNKDLLHSMGRRIASSMSWTRLNDASNDASGHSSGHNHNNNASSRRNGDGGGGGGSSSSGNLSSNGGGGGGGHGHNGMPHSHSHSVAANHGSQYSQSGHHGHSSYLSLVSQAQVHGHSHTLHGATHLGPGVAHVTGVRSETSLSRDALLLHGSHCSSSHQDQRVAQHHPHHPQYHQSQQHLHHYGAQDTHQHSRGSDRHVHGGSGLDASGGGSSSAPGSTSATAGGGGTRGSGREARMGKAHHGSSAALSRLQREHREGGMQQAGSPRHTHTHSYASLAPSHDALATQAATWGNGRGGLSGGAANDSPEAMHSGHMLPYSHNQHHNYPHHQLMQTAPAAHYTSAAGQPYGGLYGMYLDAASGVMHGVTGAGAVQQQQLGGVYPAAPASAPGGPMVPTTSPDLVSNIAAAIAAATAGTVLGASVATGNATAATAASAASAPGMGMMMPLPVPHQPHTSPIAASVPSAPPSWLSWSSFSAGAAQLTHNIALSPSSSQPQSSSSSSSNFVAGGQSVVSASTGVSDLRGVTEAGRMAVTAGGGGGMRHAWSNVFTLSTTQAASPRALTRTNSLPLSSARPSAGSSTAAANEGDTHAPLRAATSETNTAISGTSRTASAQQTLRVSWSGMDAAGVGGHASDDAGWHLASVFATAASTVAASSGSRQIPMVPRDITHSGGARIGTIASSVPASATLGGSMFAFRSSSHSIAQSLAAGRLGAGLLLPSASSTGSIGSTSGGGAAGGVYPDVGGSGRHHGAYSASSSSNVTDNGAGGRVAAAAGLGPSALLMSSSVPIDRSTKFGLVRVASNASNFSNASVSSSPSGNAVTHRSMRTLSGMGVSAGGAAAVAGGLSPSGSANSLQGLSSSVGGAAAGSGMQQPGSSSATAAARHRAFSTQGPTFRFGTGISGKALLGSGGAGSRRLGHSGGGIASASTGALSLMAAAAAAAAAGSDGGPNASSSGGDGSSSSFGGFVSTLRRTASSGVGSTVIASPTSAPSTTTTSPSHGVMGTGISRPLPMPAKNRAGSKASSPAVAAAGATALPLGYRSALSAGSGSLMDNAVAGGGGEGPLDAVALCDMTAVSLGNMTLRGGVLSASASSLCPLSSVNEDDDDDDPALAGLLAMQLRQQQQQQQASDTGMLPASSSSSETATVIARAASGTDAVRVHGGRLLARTSSLEHSGSGRLGTNARPPPMPLQSLAAPHAAVPPLPPQRQAHQHSYQQQQQHLMAPSLPSGIRASSSRAIAGALSSSVGPITYGSVHMLGSSWHAGAAAGNGSGASRAAAGRASASVHACRMSLLEAALLEEEEEEEQHAAAAVASATDETETGADASPSAAMGDRMSGASGEEEDGERGGGHRMGVSASPGGGKGLLGYDAAAKQRQEAAPSSPSMAATTTSAAAAAASTFPLFSFFANLAKGQEQQKQQEEPPQVVPTAGGSGAAPSGMVNASSRVHGHGPSNGMGHSTSSIGFGSGGDASGSGNGGGALGQRGGGSGSIGGAGGGKMRRNVSEPALASLDKGEQRVHGGHASGSYALLQQQLAAKRAAQVLPPLAPSIDGGSGNETDDDASPSVSEDETGGRHHAALAALSASLGGSRHHGSKGLWSLGSADMAGNSGSGSTTRRPPLAPASLAPVVATATAAAPVVPVRAKCIVVPRGPPAFSFSRLAMVPEDSRGALSTSLSALATTAGLMGTSAPVAARRPVLGAWGAAAAGPPAFGSVSFVASPSSLAATSLAAVAAGSSSGSRSGASALAIAAVGRHGGGSGGENDDDGPVRGGSKVLAALSSSMEPPSLLLMHAISEGGGSGSRGNSSQAPAAGEECAVAAAALRPSGIGGGSGNGRKPGGLSLILARRASEAQGSPDGAAALGLPGSKPERWQQKPQQQEGAVEGNSGDNDVSGGSRRPHGGKALVAGDDGHDRFPGGGSEDDEEGVAIEEGREGRHGRDWLSGGPLSPTLHGLAQISFSGMGTGQLLQQQAVTGAYLANAPAAALSQVPPASSGPHSPRVPSPFEGAPAFEFAPVAAGSGANASAPAGHGDHDDAAVGNGADSQGDREKAADRGQEDDDDDEVDEDGADVDTAASEAPSSYPPSLSGCLPLDPHSVAAGLHGGSVVSSLYDGSEAETIDDDDDDLASSSHLETESLYGEDGLAAPGGGAGGLLERLGGFGPGGGALGIVQEAEEEVEVEAEAAEAVTAILPEGEAGEEEQASRNSDSVHDDHGAAVDSQDARGAAKPSAADCDAGGALAQGAEAGPSSRTAAAEAKPTNASPPTPLQDALQQQEGNEQQQQQQEPQLGQTKEKRSKKKKKRSGAGKADSSSTTNTNTTTTEEGEAEVSLVPPLRPGRASHTSPGWVPPTWPPRMSLDVLDEAEAR